MSINSKMTAIADAIRGKTGRTAPLSLDAMATQIAGIETGGGDGDVVAFIEGDIDKDFVSNATKLRPYLLRSTNIETLSLPYATDLGYQLCYGCTNLKSISIPNAELLRGNTFQNCNALTEINLPSTTYMGNSDFSGCSNLQKADFGASLGTVAASSFASCTVFKTLILRGENLANLGNVSAFSGTPFAKGGTGGTVYVPSALITEYQQATNWSTLYTAGTCNFVAIEGSEYE